MVNPRASLGRFPLCTLLAYQNAIQTRFSHRRGAIAVGPGLMWRERAAARGVRVANFPIGVNWRENRITSALWSERHRTCSKEQRSGKESFVCTKWTAEQDACLASWARWHSAVACERSRQRHPLRFMEVPTYGDFLLSRCSGWVHK